MVSQWFLTNANTWYSFGRDMGTEMVEELLFISSSIWKKKKGAGLDIHLFILLLSTYSGRIVLGSVRNER